MQLRKKWILKHRPDDTHTHRNTHTPKAAADPGDDCVQLEWRWHFAFRVPLICLQSFTDVSSIVILTTASYHEFHCTVMCCIVLAKGFNQYLWVLLKWIKFSALCLLNYCNSHQIRDSAALNAKALSLKGIIQLFKSLLNWLSFKIHFIQHLCSPKKKGGGVVFYLQ